MKRTTTVALTGAALLALTLTACGGSSSTGASGPGAKVATSSKNLEVFSWWTSGSEDAALKDLTSAYATDFPGVKVQNGAVAGGGGGNAQQILQTRLQGGNPPDTW